MYARVNGVIQWFCKHHSRAVVFVVLLAVLGMALVWLFLPQATHDEYLSSSMVQQERVIPARVRIPRIAIDAAFEEPLGVTQDGAVEVPDNFDMVGWYKYGPLPGEVGPAVVLGHVDSFEGPEVFWRLRELVIGDQIEIEQANGSSIFFEVERLETASQDDFPTAEVYGDIPYAGLRLITCSGTYDHDSGLYSHNLIVYARLIEK